MNRYVSLARRILVTAAAALLLTGCDVLDSLLSPSDLDDPFLDQAFTIDQGSVTLSPGRVEVRVFSTTEPGNLAATVDWGSVNNSIELLLYPEICTEADILADRLTGTCSDQTLVAETDVVPVAKPNVLIAPNLASGTYTLAIEYDGQPGQTDETVTFNIILSPMF